MTTGTDRTFTIAIRYTGNPGDVDEVMGHAASWLYQSLDSEGKHSKVIEVIDAGTGERFAYLAYPDDEPPEVPVEHQFEHNVGDLAPVGVPGGRFEVFCAWADDKTITNVFEGIHYCPSCGHVVERPADGNGEGS